MIITFSRILILLIVTNVAFAELSVTETAIVRECEESYCESSVMLEDLLNSESFEGKYFKIVKGKESEAISFDEEDEFLKLKAATTYYHLTKARNYFVDKIKSDYVKNMSQIVVRIDITNKFHERGHFANDNLSPQFNNALSVEPGNGHPKYGIQPWGHEIWFRPQKVIKVSGSSHEELAALQGAMIGQFHKASAQGLFHYFLTQLAISVRDGSGLQWSSFQGYLSSLAISEGIYYGLQGVSYIASKRKVDYFIETALVPEIIYHEFSHIALSDGLSLTHSSPVNEGFADYFAIRIAENPTIAKSIEKYSTAVGKDGENELGYNAMFEDLSYANIDFVMALLWDIKRELGPVSDELVYDLRNRISTNSNIRNDLLKGLLMSCRSNCKEPMIDRYKLLTIFKNRGF